MCAGMRVSFGFRQSVDKLQAPCKLGGYVQEGRGGPTGSSHTRPAVPTEALRSVDNLLRSKAFACDVLRQSYR